MTPENPNEKKPTEQNPNPFSSKDNFIIFVTNHKWDVFAYIIIIIGLITTLYNQITGGFLVGIIMGIYFSEQLRLQGAYFKEFLDQEGIFRGFIVVAAFIALLMMALGLVVGAVVGAFIRPYLGKLVSSPFEKK